MVTSITEGNAALDLVKSISNNKLKLVSEEPENTESETLDIILSLGRFVVNSIKRVFQMTPWQYVQHITITSGLSEKDGRSTSAKYAKDGRFHETVSISEDKAKILIDQGEIYAFGRVMNIGRARRNTTDYRDKSRHDLYTAQP